MLFGAHTAYALELKETKCAENTTTTIIKSHVDNIEYRLTYNSNESSLDLTAYDGTEPIRFIPEGTLVHEEYTLLYELFERDKDGFWYDLFFIKENEQYLKDYLNHMTNKYLKFFY